MSFLDEVRAEGEAIQRWWVARLPDGADGFHGEIDADGRAVPEADRSIILYTRLLWYFSAVGERDLAGRAADYIRRHFVAPDGGVVWMLDARGQVADGKLQGYAQAFAVYAFAEYHRLTGDAGALAFARGLQSLIETRFRDVDLGGYIEALGGDQRLSDKDLDAPKTMNTHLHVLEAWTRLHQVAPDAATEAALRRAVTVFLDRFAGRHLRLFFDMDWTDRTQSISFGHDIEASWLLWEAVEALGDADILARARPCVLALARSTLTEGFNTRGGLGYERGFDGHLDEDGEWWGQAEGMVGFVNGWQMTGEDAFLDAAERLWACIKTQYRDGDNEWTWYAKDANRPPVYKAGPWKCPYHNGRAMIELEKRLA